MQGRLSPLADGRIQSFPWEFWQREFATAQQIGFGLMEWTLDQERLYENPLLTTGGQNEICALCARYKMALLSLTGDCFMQAPFWKAPVEQRLGLEEDFIAIANACKAVGIRYVVVPLVDNGRLENQDEENLLVRFLQDKTEFLASRQLRLILESDFSPVELARLIDRLDPVIFGINYDIGNSAALGYAPREEFAAYGDRILNVHVKDRVLGGTTVPLGTGDADFEAVFSELGDMNYRGNFILQTARAVDDDHASPLVRYRDMTVAWMAEYGLT